jgi:glutathione synthase/RimK-type ligase-like ATP-grasp enzyme
VTHPPRVALATAAHLPELDEDGPALLAALAAEDLDADVRVWDDPSVSWGDYDLVVIRSTWDYWDKYDEFLAWTRAVPRLANPASVVAWNTDKTYLGRLAEAGVPVVPTTYLTELDGWAPPDEPFVVKPTVSAAARDSAAYQPGDPAAVDHVRALLGAGKQVMVQPYVSAVDAEGETALLVFGGEVSHAARKAAILQPGAGVDNTIVSRNLTVPSEATPEELALAQQVLDVVRGWGEPELLYARVDMLPGPVLIELEVTEPSFFLRHSPGSATRFARAVRRALETTRATQ